MKKELFILDKSDNVGVTFTALQSRQESSAIIPAGHKVALCDIPAGAAVIKYGAVIGYATVDIYEGGHVHIHNLKTGLSDKSVYEKHDYRQPDAALPVSGRPLMLYRRGKTKCGIRNELWVVPTVGCVNGTAASIVRRFIDRYNENGLPGIDGVFSFPHPYGCSQLGDDHTRTRTLLQNLVLHPNAGGVIVLGLGCENNQIKTFRETLPDDADFERLEFLESQSVEDEIEAGVEALSRLYEKAKDDKRTQGQWSDLVIGLECGGSDALSGITANPLIGRVSDRIIASGGSTVLTEVPEMFGAENVLLKQCPDDELFSRTAEMINQWKTYYTAHNLPVYENPSPGNKAGGITTLEEKSLGCIRKAGSSAIVDVAGMEERISRQGLNLLHAPGNDIVATTLLGTAGCQLVLFSTGRGTPLGGFIPTLKISSSTELYGRKKHWIDFNAGIIAEGIPAEKAAELLLDRLAAVVNGEETAAEQNGIREIALFKDGVTL